MKEEREEMRLLHPGCPCTWCTHRELLAIELVPAWGNEFDACEGKIREAFEGGFFDEAGLGCMEGLMEFEPREERRDPQH